MNLDKRILPDKKPLTAFDETESKFNRYELVDFLRDYIQSKLDNDKPNMIAEQVVIIVSTGCIANQLKPPIWNMLKIVDNGYIKAIVNHDALEIVNIKDKNFFKMSIAIGRPDEFFFTGRRPKTVLVYGTNYTAEQMGRIFEFITMHEQKNYCVRFFNR